MQTIQIIGPYSAGDIVVKELAKVYKILQIGIEYPNTTPIGQYTAAPIPLEPLIKIDNQEFILTNNRILEYNGLFQSEITITFLKDVGPLTIIDLIFKDVDE